MNMKNYYPLRIGQIGKVTYVLSDTKTNDRYLDHENCTGWIVAEGLSLELMEDMAGAYNANHIPSQKNSAHSFTEGMDLGRTNSTQELDSDRPAPAEEQPTLDEQIKWLDKMHELSRTQYPKKHQDQPDSPYEKMLKSIKENLLAIQRWNRNPLWKQMDVEKVITDLLKVISIFEKTGQHNGISKTSAIQNAEAALGMLQAFKEERDKPANIPEGVKKHPVTPVDVVNAHHAGKNILDPKTFEIQDNATTADLIYKELHESINLSVKFMENDDNVIQIQEAAKLMVTSLQNGGKILSIGNGGSYSDAQHFASELSGKFRQPRPAIAAMALSDGGALTCIANDFGYNQVFKRQVEAIGKAGDVLLCLSTSGNSENILVAAERARSMGITVIGICGNSGGKLKEYLDVMIEIPHAGTADRVQELSIIIIHILVNLIEKGV
jgi:D-sedoheptulose 7-phosphate isomerase